MEDVAMERSEAGASRALEREPTEMELRVSRALDDLIEGWFSDRAEAKLNTVDLARAAIRAMREPTKHMCIVGNDEVREHCYTDGTESMGYGTLFEPWCAAKTWEAMIDSASPVGPQ
jgi:hypothetical protein